MLDGVVGEREKYTGPVSWNSEHTATIYRRVGLPECEQKNRIADLGLMDCERDGSCRGLIINSSDGGGFWAC